MGWLYITVCASLAGQPLLLSSNGISVKSSRDVLCTLLSLLPLYAYFFDLPSLLHPSIFFTLVTVLFCSPWEKNITTWYSDLIIAIANHEWHSSKHIWSWVVLRLQGSGKWYQGLATSYTSSYTFLSCCPLGLWHFAGVVAAMVNGRHSGIA